MSDKAAWLYLSGGGSHDTIEIGTIALWEEEEEEENRDGDAVPEGYRVPIMRRDAGGTLNWPGRPPMSESSPGTFLHEIRTTDRPRPDYVYFTLRTTCHCGGASRQAGIEGISRRPGCGKQRPYVRVRPPSGRNRDRPTDRLLVGHAEGKTNSQASAIL